MDREDLVRQIDRVIDHPGVRSADRANLSRMVKILKKGGALDYQDRVNLWAYLSRYQPYLESLSHEGRLGRPSPGRTAQ